MITSLDQNCKLYFQQKNNSLETASTIPSLLLGNVTSGNIPQQKAKGLRYKYEDISWRKNPSFKGSIEGYLAGLSKTHRKIAEFFLSYRTAKHIRLTNKYVAGWCECSRRTVTRATNKFDADGFIVKQQDGRYTPNDFKISPITQRGTQAYSRWLNSQSQENLQLMKDHGAYINGSGVLCFLNKFVTLTNRINNNSLFIYKELVPYSGARGLTPGKQGLAVVDGDGYEAKQKFRRRKRIEKGIAMLSQAHKEFVLKNRTSPQVKDLLNMPAIRSKLITPDIEELAKLFGLDERHMFKLVAFCDDALQLTVQDARKMFAKKYFKVSDVDSWLMDTATRNGLLVGEKPDWQWYYSLCEITGIEKCGDEPPRPLTIGTPPPLYAKPTYNKPTYSYNNRPKYNQDEREALRTTSYAGKTRREIMSDAWRPPVDSRDQQIEKLKAEIANCTRLLKDPDTNLKEPFKEVSIKVITNMLESSKLKLAELEAVKDPTRNNPSINSLKREGQDPYTQQNQHLIAKMFTNVFS